MGRHKKPVALALRDGDRKSRINSEAPKATEGLGDPPEWLDGFALEGWQTLARELGPMRVATLADRQLAMCFCEAFSDYRQAKEIVDRDGMLIEQTHESSSLSGGAKSPTTRKSHPLLPTLREARNQMMKCLGQFGMTPSARAALRMEPADDEDEFVAFEKRGRRGQG